MARKIAKPPKLNLIPILDAIFIFIFFLLMSAQFLDIFEIGSDAPISASSESHPEKDPLNLTLELSDDTITVKTGLNGDVKKKIQYKEISLLNDLLIDIKKDYPKESSVILKPTSGFKYHKIVKVIDNAREVLKPGVVVPSVDDKGRKTASTKLFDQIIFETQE